MTLGMLSEASWPSYHFAGADSLQDVAVLAVLREQSIGHARQEEKVKSAES